MLSQRTAAALMLIAGSTAHAQWTVTYLHPAGAGASFAMGGSGTTQVGYVDIGGLPQASMWSGTAASWVDLSPAGANWSCVTGVSGTTQVGYALIGGVRHAGRWSGTAASWVDLSPAGSTESYATGVSGTTQVGYALIGGVYHAGRWSGTAASWVELSQSGALYGISGTQQVGYASVSGHSHASLWNGTAASWVDLYPYADSVAYATTGTQQVGTLAVPTGYGVDTTHAVVWSGTAESMIDLNPWDSEFAPARCSAAYGVFGPYQVGHFNFLSFNAIGHAALWTGTTESLQDLSLALTGSWNASVAMSIWSDGTRLYVTGYGYRASPPEMKRSYGRARLQHPATPTATARPPLPF